MDRPKIANANPIASMKHQDKRTNIPTEELRDFMAEEESAPAVLFYPRDPSLDPQLVWKGKDEQDQQDLAVPVVPIYIQEKIHPQAIIEQVRAEAQTDRPQQASLFADFNGIAFEELIDFYHHEQNWSNRLILGDALLVMTSLAEKEGLKGKVQMLYLDPPYGIKFGSNWQVSTRKRDVKDGKIEDLTRQPEQIKAFRDTWELGIHSYLTYLRDRLIAVRELLSESGSIFVQIGDENVHLVRCLLEEVFGAENFVALIAIKKTGGLTQSFMPMVTDYLLWYAKNKLQIKWRPLYSDKAAGADSDYQNVELSDGQRRRLSRTEADDIGNLPVGARIFQTTSLESENPSFAFEYNGKSYVQKWKTNSHGLLQLAQANRLYEATSKLRYVRYHEDFPVIPTPNIWEDTVSSGYRDDAKIYW